jgi:hypothetical protein
MMARIRSVHPGLFTDEAFATLSDAAQVFLIGLWTEADDQGVFEWKPVTLRMRIRPAKDGDVTEILSELQDANCIRPYEIGGRQYGAIRNFRKFQRPKSPNEVHPVPDDFRKYLGLPETISEMDRVKPEPFPQNGEIAPQMEDVGKDVEKEEGGRRKRGANAPADFAFVGEVIRLKQKNLDEWREAYFLVPDIVAELRAADAYYVDNPPKDGKIFWAASSWLKREHDRRLSEREAEKRADDEIYRNVL